MASTGRVPVAKAAQSHMSRFLLHQSTNNHDTPSLLQVTLIVAQNIANLIALRQTTSNIISYLTQGNVFINESDLALAITTTVLNFHNKTNGIFARAAPSNLRQFFTAHVLQGIASSPFPPKATSPPGQFVVAVIRL